VLLVAETDVCVIETGDVVVPDMVDPVTEADVPVRETDVTEEV
jgi:hypothetical protein